MTDKQKIIILRTALENLIAQYWYNKGAKSEFIACITPRDIPSCWRFADKALQKTKQ